MNNLVAAHQLVVQRDAQGCGTQATVATNEQQLLVQPPDCFENNNV